MTAGSTSRLPLVSTMAGDLDEHGSLRASTAATMWTAYAAHTAFTGWSLARGALPLPVPEGVARPVGAAMLAAGAGLCVAGMGRFAGAEELTGTRNQTLLTTGVYRWSRNPQYLGYLLALTGAGLGRRSGAALGAAAALGAVYSAWIPVEERHLTGLHGQPYADYCRRTRRWWGRCD